MGRPSASEANKSFALEFAKLVTQRSDNPDDLVARCGQCSIFSALRDVCPDLIRDAANREGLTEIEYNKMLQVQITTLHLGPG
jgi:hypothetical protein